MSSGAFGAEESKEGGGASFSFRGLNNPRNQSFY